MKRRNFLKAMFAAPVAAPAALAEVSNGLASVPLAYDRLDGPNQGIRYYGNSDAIHVPLGDYLSRLKDELARYLIDPPPLKNYIGRVSRLDADIASNRSLSLAAKVRTQAARNRAVDMAETTSKLRQAIQDHTPSAS